jgi:hypothetical protein
MKRRSFLWTGVALVLTAILLFSGCSDDSGGDEEEPTGGVTPQETGAVVSYASNGVPTVTYTFDVAVTVDATAYTTYTFSGSGTTSIAATPTGTAGTEVTVSFIVANSADPGKTATVSSQKVRITSGALSRPADSAVQYTIDYADDNGAYGLKQGSTTVWKYVASTTDVGKIFNAIYTPNKPGSTDVIGAYEPGKSAIPYTQTISDAVLDLFKVTLGATATDDKIEIAGSDLSAVTTTGANQDNLIVIDVGIPGANNSDLPKFYIPYRELGAETNNGYGHIRFRVNNGAQVVVLADNTITGPSEPGYFTGGCVEVMAGGYLRDGAYQGFPLGDNAVILNRYNSYLSVQPEDTQMVYSGYLLAPAGVNHPTGGATRIFWDEEGNEAGSYLEVRPNLIATNAKLKVVHPLYLIYSVWFVDDAQLTIDLVDPDTETVNEGEPVGRAVLTNSNGAFKFYGNEDAQIVIKAKNKLHKIFVTPGTDDAPNFVGSDTEETILTGTGDGSSSAQGAVQYGTGTGIYGTNSWTGADTEVDD